MKLSRNLPRATVFAAALLAGVSQFWTPPAGAQSSRRATIQESDLRTWLTYLASDELTGRQLFTEGYGLAAGYISERLQDFGVKPMGGNGSYFQVVKQNGYRLTNNSSVTVDLPNGQSKTFKQGDHVTFPNNAGGKQTLTFSGVEFVGYGAIAPEAGYDDYKDRDVKGKLVVMLGAAPAAVPTATPANARPRYALETKGAKAVLRFAAALAPPTPAEEALTKAQAALAQAAEAVTQAQQQLLQVRTGRGGRGVGAGRGGAVAPVADLTTVQRVDNLIPPVMTGDDAFYEFLFSAGPSKFADLKARADKGESLGGFPMPAAQVTVNVDVTYEVISTQLTENVVGMVEGTDPALKDTFIMFGAHLDHVGYRASATAGRGGRGAAPLPPGAKPDLIFNGADDDGSGSTGLLGIAKAFATGPKPKRSVLFVWHTGEESGLQGSRYMADFPVVPAEKVQAQLNIDMIGRNRDDDPKQIDTVFVIGADRISTDLHNAVVTANLETAKPLTLDYEYNDPNDRNSFYTRSDHYSYAVKGIPIAFFFTGTHPDYHGAGDHVDKIIFPKLARVAQLVYELGLDLANSTKPLERDNRGPRTGKGFAGKIVK